MQTLSNLEALARWDGHRVLVQQTGKIVVARTNLQKNCGPKSSYSNQKKAVENVEALESSYH